jgi:hypothetical protein
MDRPDFHAPFPLVLRYRQGIDAIVFGMSANELHEGHLPTEIKGDHQAIVSSCNLEPGDVRGLTLSILELHFGPHPLSSNALLL